MEEEEDEGPPPGWQSIPLPSSQPPAPAPAPAPAPPSPSGESLPMFFSDPITDISFITSTSFNEFCFFFTLFEGYPLGD